ncbi:MAG TPA: hypothetical protein PLA02_04460 [Brevefilum fermentans]|nr:hypothetical protein [Brevefilum fermentans]
MNWKLSLLMSMLLISLLFLNGCAVSGTQEQLSFEDQASTSVAETLMVMQSVETIVAMTVSAGEIEQPALEATAEPPTPTATFTEIPTETMVPTLTFTATYAVPMVSVSVPTNCRLGPGEVYAQVSVLLVGTQVEVVARSADGDYWVVRNPGGEGTCWLWGYYAIVLGHTGNLPVWDPPPTPAPAATYTTVPLTPSTYSTGALEIEQTYTADLDEGLLNGGSGKDLWYQVVSATERYLTPINGAGFAVWGGSAPGMSDCIGASLSTTSIPLSSSLVGTYVCYRTNEGRPGAFRVNELTGTTIKIGYTTWNKP